jgi:hypothetical protein
MAFKKLVRYEHGGETHYGDLISSGSHGFLVKRLDGNIQNGFNSTTDEPVTVTKVALRWTPYRDIDTTIECLADE